jgi:hypothetical protein
VAGWFEEKSSEYPKLAWLVDSDLVRLIWSPSYTSEERQRTDGAYPLFTAYRLLVSGTVFHVWDAEGQSFVRWSWGCCECVRLDLRSGRYIDVSRFFWLSWTWLTYSLKRLYVLGLYEYNPVNMMPYLFETHYDDQFYSGGFPVNLET